MYTVNYQDAPVIEVLAEDVQGTTIQWLLDPSRGAPTFAMRRFVIGPGGHTPCHEHDWEHQVYVLRGTGVLGGGEGEVPLMPGLAVLVLPGERHQFRCDGPEELEFLCLVPNGPATGGQ